jgi:hypothetical protein
MRATLAGFFLASLLLANLRFPARAFLAGVFGNPTLQRLSADGRMTTVSTVKASLR